MITGEPVEADRAKPLLEVRNLTIEGLSSDGPFTIVNRVSFSVDRGGTLAVVGESGSGKSMTARAILGLQPPGVTMVGGSINFDGRELGGATESELRQVRGRRIAMVFQDPMSSLNPVYTIGFQLVEALRSRGQIRRAAARRRAVELLGDVRIPNPSSRLDQYPHQFSGGMRQRIMIAMALAMEPDLLVADEPTTALDVTVQAGILRLLERIQQDRGLALILISHDLGVVARIADEVAIMYAGRFVEQGAVERVYESPSHPYTKGLLDAVPAHDRVQNRLASIPGRPPELTLLPTGCSFHPRCSRNDSSRCVLEVPLLTSGNGEGRLVACHHPLANAVEVRRNR